MIVPYVQEYITLLLLNAVISFSVAPICYAHLAAAQMGQFLKFEEFVDTSSGSGVDSSLSATIPELPRLHAHVCSSMFFCWGDFGLAIVG